MSLIVKICGLSTPKRLDVALEAGADMVGFVFFPPSPRHSRSTTARDAWPRACAAARKRWRSRSMPTMRCSARSSRPCGPTCCSFTARRPPARVAALKTRFGLPVMKAIAVAAKGDLARSARLHGCGRPSVVRRPRAARRRRGRAGWAGRSTGTSGESRCRPCRSCCRAGSMPAMSARLCASPRRRASMFLPASSARRARRIRIRSAPSCARRATAAARLAAKPVDEPGMTVQQPNSFRTGPDEQRALRHLWRPLCRRDADAADSGTGAGLREGQGRSRNFRRRWTAISRTMSAARRRSISPSG